jgi:hypothetical protein
MNTSQKINIRFIVLLGFIVLAGCMRLLNSFSPNPVQNFTPLGAMALFGGCYLKESWKAYLMPLMTLWLTDIIINRFLIYGNWVFFYDGFLWVYGVFALIVLLGTLMLKKVNLLTVIGTGITASLAHWLITDFGVWLGGGTNPFTGLPYTKDLQGYWDCLVAALPFLKNFLLGTLGYSLVLFGGFEFAKRQIPALAIQ